MLVNGLLVLVPISLVFAYVLHMSSPSIFLTAALAIIPLATWVRRGTEQLAKRVGPNVGGLVNITFGNVPELLIGLFLIGAGDTDAVKGQIAGSIIGNSLLGLGLAILIGGWRHHHQTLQAETAGLLSTLLILSVIALLVPAIFSYAERNTTIASPIAGRGERLSIGVSTVLLGVYGANLLYTLVTHRDLFATEANSEEPSWPLWQSLVVLLCATVAIVVETELISAALTATATQWHLSSFFLGVTVLAVIGNAAEYIAAIYFASRDELALAMNITVGSSIQVALFVAPLLVLLSLFFQSRMDLVFSNPLELIGIAGVAFAVDAISDDGHTTWFEGVLLLSVYAILGLAFFYSIP